jgi:hypothetical protein
MLKGGVPSTQDFFDCIQGSTFHLMEAFSSAFLKRNRKNLMYYSLRWSEDPLHHLTRQFEYPFAFEEIEEGH